MEFLVRIFLGRDGVRRMGEHVLSLKEILRTFVARPETRCCPQESVLAAAGRRCGVVRRGNKS